MPDMRSFRVNDHPHSSREIGGRTDKQQVHHEIVLAQNELREARGRVLEASTESQILEIVTFLRRVGVYLERANQACAGWTTSYANKSSAARRAREHRAVSRSTE